MSAFHDELPLLCDASATTKKDDDTSDEDSGNEAFLRRHNPIEADEKDHGITIGKEWDIPRIEK